MESDELRLRKPDCASDWHAIRRICCQTAVHGRPIDLARWPFFGENWIGPYQALAPTWTYVLEGQQRVVGYLTGCPDTGRRWRSKRFLFRLRLAARILVRQFSWNADARRFLRRTFGLDTGPEESFPRQLWTLLDRDYPAHLHVNLLEEVRSTGSGSRLLEAYFGDLRATGVPGVHLFCGEGPLGFYLKNGFSEQARIEFKVGIPVICLVKSLL